MSTRTRHGHTLFELVIAANVAALLMIGMASSIYIASQAYNQTDGTAGERVRATFLLTQLDRDVSQALTFTELTANAATFTVPDRDGDNRQETIRYAWSGTPGDPLTYEYNGSPPATLADHVQTFTLNNITRVMEAPVIPPPGGGGGNQTVLLVVTNAATPTAQETARQTLIESWGYDVALISATDSQANFDAAAATSNVAYISEEINSSDVGTKLTNAPIGVVNEEANLVDEFGMSETLAWPSATDYFDRINNSHYITESFTTGALTIFTVSESVAELSGNLSPDLKILGQIHGGSGPQAGLAILESGADLYGGGTAAGRRVQLPWGANAMDINILNNDGRTIMRRSIEWAAGAGDTVVGNLLFVSAGSVPTAQEQLKVDLIESWGYGAMLIDAAALPVDFMGSMAMNDVVYISGEVSDATLGKKAGDTTLGVVNEQITLHDELGFSSSMATNAFDKIADVDNSHEITSGFPTGWLTIATSSQPLQALQGTLAPGLQTLAKVWISGANYDDGLSLLEQGAGLESGGNAPGRRVQLPWGGSGFSFAALNDNGRTIMQRSIEWAAKPAAPPPTGGIVFEEFTEAKLGGNGTNLVINMPAGTAQGDLLIAAVATDGDTTGSLAAPAGWNLIVVEERFAAVTFAVWWKLATASEPATANFTWSGGQKAYGWIMRFTGHDPATPINDWASLTTGSGSTLNPVSPEVTTTVNNALILRLGGFDDDDVNIDAPGLPSHTAITMDESGNGNGTASGGAGYTTQPTAGASGTSTFTLTGMEQTVAVTIAIAPTP